MVDAMSLVQETVSMQKNGSVMEPLKKSRMRVSLGGLLTSSGTVVLIFID